MGNLFVKLRERRWENGLAIGINPYKDWEKLYNILSQCHQCWDGDIGEWDASVSPEIQELINEKVANKFIGTLEDRLILDKVLNLSIQSWVIAGNKKMFKTHGILSGMWITNLFNSLINRCYSAGWYFREYTKLYHNSPTVTQFLSDVVDYVQGDDKIVGIRSKDKDKLKSFNALTMENYYVDCGMTFTDGRKGKIDYLGKPLHECVFLKRSFLFHNDLGKMMGPIEIDTITNSIMWYKDDNEEREIMKDKLLVFQREAYLMHPIFREILIGKIKEKIKQDNMQYDLVSDDYLKEAYIS